MTTVSQSPTNFEQALLEMTNRARLDPQGEYDALLSDDVLQGNVAQALSFFGVDLNAFRAQLVGADAVAPLAWSPELALAADGHSQMMITHDTQSHQLPGEEGIGARITAAGYTGWNRVSENVYAFARDAVYAHAGFYIDWGYDDADFTNGVRNEDWRTTGDGIQDPAGHRIAILHEGMTEIGISVIAEEDSETSVGPYVVTQNFGNRVAYQPQLLGVVIEDGDGDRFYDMGEGLGGVEVVASNGSQTYRTTTWASGGYQMELPSGTYEVQFSGGGLVGVITRQITMGEENLKVDAVAADAVVVEVPRVLTGTAAADQLQGDAAVNQYLLGLAGPDVLAGVGGRNIVVGDTVQIGLVQELSDQVYRLYGATLGRVPDTQGHLNWVNQLFEENMTLTEVAGAFVGSREFLNVYGNLNDSDFVERLYLNVLGRPSDAAGRQHWLDQLAGGTERGDVVAGFSESREYQGNTALAAFQYREARTEAVWSDDVYRLYQATLDRAPDAGGFADWIGRLGRQTDYLSVVEGFISSTEFNNTYGQLTDDDFIEQLYLNVLDRASDVGGKANWLNHLADGGTRATVVEGFAQSQEFINTTADAVVTYMRGLDGGDRILLGNGQDKVLGGAYADAFVLSVADGASHEIWDFEAWDHLDLSDFGFSDAASARAAFVQQGDDVVFSRSEVTLRLHDVDLSILDSDTLIWA